jgi:hypothetical protein
MHAPGILTALPLVLASAAPPAWAGAADPDTIAYIDRQTTGNSVGLNVTNYGFLGNDLITRDPSLEYPLGSEVDHLIRAGLWIGAVNVQGDTLVTTGAVDGYWRTGGTNVSEFTPRTRSILERSNLIHNASYSPRAVSEQDFLCRFDDLGSKPRPGIEPHRPLGVEVLQTTYLWSSVFADAFVIVRSDIRNVSGSTLTNLYLGMYVQLVSGFKGAFETWPPSGWFWHNRVQYEEDLSLVLEHDATFGGGFAPYWAGMKFLGARPEPAADLVAFNIWHWSPGNTSLDEDAEKYVLIGNGEVDDAGAIVSGQSPIELLSVGPFRNFADGDTLEVVFAFVGGTSYEDIRANAEWAQQAYDHDYVLPSPPPSPRLVVRPAKNRLELWWDDSPESVVDPFDGRQDFEGYRAYVTRREGTLAEDYTRVGEFDRADTPVGYNTGLAIVRAPEPLEMDGITYPYCQTLESLKDGFRYWVAVTSFDQGSPVMPSLESGVFQNRTMAVPGPSSADRRPEVTVFPNPYHGDAVWDGARERERLLWFANLPDRATIRIYTLGGDLVQSVEFDGASYSGEDITALRAGEGERQAFSGTMYGWDLISRNDQPVASGLYLYTVTDRASAETSVGKFMVIR